MEIINYQKEYLEGCRELWQILTLHHREIYDNHEIGGSNPGLYFDSHLEKVGKDRIWVAIEDEHVVGLVGLEEVDGDLFVEPIVLHPQFRDKGLGRQLLEFAKDTAQQLGFSSLSVKPVMRNISAISFFHSVGFQRVGHIELFLNLNEASSTKWRSDLSIFGLDFEY